MGSVKSFNRMRSQGKLVTFLLITSIVLGILVFVLIQQQQNILAQYAAIVLVLVTGLGLINDILELRIV
jgi:lipoprotein signal peptidase